MKNMQQSDFGFNIDFEEDPKKKSKKKSAQKKQKGIEALKEKIKKADEISSVFDLPKPASPVSRPNEAEAKEPHIFTVSELTDTLKNLINQTFLNVWVVGEVSNAGPSSSGHFHFVLKDEGASIKAVIFKNILSRMPFQIKDGIQLVCHGKLDVYKKGGSYSLIVDSAEPKGLGALQLAFEQLKKKLEAEGLFKKEFKKPLPFLPKKVGVVTAVTGAAIRDIINVMTRRFPNVEILLHPAKVQGDGAAAEVVRAIEELDRRGDIDVMIVGRGGGSIEDLWAFNEEAVARAIFAAKTPIISAVGHEIDFTIADFVADLRAPTPSAAAEIVVPDKNKLISDLQQMRRRYLLAVKKVLEVFWQRVQRLKSMLKDPSLRFADLIVHLDNLTEHLQYAMRVFIKNREAQLSKLVSNLDHLSPIHILAKGYAVVKKHGGDAPLKSTGDLKIGDNLDITMDKGKLEARITKVVD